MKTLLSLVTLALAASSAGAQLTYPLTYAAAFGYSNYGLRNDGAPPNNPFQPRTAFDVFRPEVPAVPAVANVYAAAPYFHGNSYLYNSFPFNYGGYLGGYYGNFQGSYAPFGLPRYFAPTAISSAPAVTAAIPAAAAPIAVEAPVAPLVKESIGNEVTVVEADAIPAPSPDTFNPDLIRSIIPSFSLGRDNVNFLKPHEVPALKVSDGSDGGVVSFDGGLTPAFYSGLPRFAVRPSPITLQTTQ